MTTPTVRHLLTIAVTDPTHLTPDVIEACEVGTTHEIYPDPPGDPAWIDPQGAVVFDPAVLRLVLAAALVGLEGAPKDAGDIGAAWRLVRILETSLLGVTA